MDGQAVRRKSDDLADGALYILFRFFRQTQNQVHVDVVKALCSRQIKGVNDILHGMPAADQAQRLFLHGLRVHADAGNTVLFNDTQLLLCDAVRASCFHSEFLPAACKAFFDQRQQPVHLIRLQCGRRSAADVDSVRLFSELLHHLRAGADFLLKCIEIFVHTVPEAFYGIRREGAVQAGRRTEGNADIEAVSVLIINTGKDLPLTHSDICRQISLPGAYKMFLHQIPCRILHGLFGAVRGLPGGVRICCGCICGFFGGIWICCGCICGFFGGICICGLF